MKKTLILIFFISSILNAQGIHISSIPDAHDDNKKKKELIIKNNIREILTTYQHNKTGDNILSIIDIYDKNGNHIERYLIKDDKVNFKILNEHNEKNLMTKQVGYKANDEISFISLYQYDDNGNRIAFKKVTENGEILHQEKRIYNIKNQNTERYYFNKKTNNFYLRNKYTYNDNNQYSLFESYDNQGKLTETAEYLYKNGNLAKLVSKRNGKKYKKHKTSYKYNPKGQLTKKIYHIKTHHILNGKEYVFKKWQKKTQYDNENNLTSKISSGNGIKFNIARYFYKKHE